MLGEFGFLTNERTSLARDVSCSLHIRTRAFGLGRRKRKNYVITQKMSSRDVDIIVFGISAADFPSITVETVIAYLNNVHGKYTIIHR